MDGFGFGEAPASGPDAQGTGATLPAPVSPTPEQRGDLVRALTALASEVDLHAVLQRVVRTSRALVRARYAAAWLGDADGRPGEFVYSGMDFGTVERIAQLPGGHGVVGLAVRDDTPVRLDEVRGHPAFTAFPRHHPVIHGFLGVPIRTRDRAPGTLYVADSAAGRFDAADEQLLVSLAGAAAGAGRQTPGSGKRRREPLDGRPRPRNSPGTGWPAMAITCWTSSCVARGTPRQRTSGRSPSSSRPVGSR